MIARLTCKSAIAEEKANADDGVVSLIPHAEIDGRPLSDKEVFGVVCFPFIGGLDTVLLPACNFDPEVFPNTSEVRAWKSSARWRNDPNAFRSCR